MEPQPGQGLESLAMSAALATESGLHAWRPPSPSISSWHVGHARASQVPHRHLADRKPRQPSAGHARTNLLSVSAAAAGASASPSAGTTNRWSLSRARRSRAAASLVQLALRSRLASAASRFVCLTRGASRRLSLPSAPWSRRRSLSTSSFSSR